MTNTENVKLIREVNEAYALLLSAALATDNKYAYDKLKKDRHYLCDSIDRYYYQNKTSSLPTTTITN